MYQRIIGMTATSTQQCQAILLHAEGFTYPKIAQQTSYRKEYQAGERKSAGSGRPRKHTQQVVQMQWNL